MSENAIHIYLAKDYFIMACQHSLALQIMEEAILLGIHYLFYNGLFKQGWVTVKYNVVDWELFQTIYLLQTNTLEITNE